jgi:hypothetical protein
MVVALDGNSIELHLQRLIDLLRDNLSPIVFSDNPTTKMYDSLSMILFHFEILLKLYEVRGLGWAAYPFHGSLAMKLCDTRGLTREFEWNGSTLRTVIS